MGVSDDGTILKCTKCKAENVEGSCELIAGKVVCKKCREKWRTRWKKLTDAKRNKILDKKIAEAI